MIPTYSSSDLYSQDSGETLHPGRCTKRANTKNSSEVLRGAGAFYCQLSMTPPYGGLALRIAHGEIKGQDVKVLCPGHGQSMENNK